MRLLFLDIETTGFNRKLDSIIELAGIIYNDETKKKEATFHAYVKPKKRIPIHITEITGITNQMVFDKEPEDKVIEEFIKFIEEQKPDTYIGHNIDAFDHLWLQEKSIFYGLSYPKIATIDTLKVARKIKAPTSELTKTGNPSYRQESIAKAYRIEYDAHSALADVEALIQIYEKMNAAETVEVEKMPVDRRRIKLGF